MKKQTKPTSETIILCLNEGPKGKVCRLKKGHESGHNDCHEDPAVRSFWIDGWEDAEFKATEPKAEVKSEIATCCNCLFIETIGSDAVCRRYPPTFTPNGYGLKATFPPTIASGWCGEWKAGEDIKFEAVGRSVDTNAHQEPCVGTVGGLQ